MFWPATKNVHLAQPKYKFLIRKEEAFQVFRQETNRSEERKPRFAKKKQRKPRSEEEWTQPWTTTGGSRTFRICQMMTWNGRSASSNPKWLIFQCHSHLLLEKITSWRGFSGFSFPCFILYILFIWGGAFGFFGFEGEKVVADMMVGWRWWRGVLEIKLWWSWSWLVMGFLVWDDNYVVAWLKRAAGWWCRWLGFVRDERGRRKIRKEEESSFLIIFYG